MSGERAAWGHGRGGRIPWSVRRALVVPCPFEGQLDWRPWRCGALAGELCMHEGPKVGRRYVRGWTHRDRRLLVRRELAERARLSLWIM